MRVVAGEGQLSLLPRPAPPRHRWFPCVGAFRQVWMVLDGRVQVRGYVCSSVDEWPREFMGLEFEVDERAAEVLALGHWPDYREWTREDLGIGSLQGALL